MAEILQSWLDATPWMPKLHKLAETEAFLAHLCATTHITVAAGDRVQGFLSRDGARIPALYVAASVRGAGTGSALVEAAKVTQPRLHLWAFQANDAARRFYARHGFREVERTDGSRNDEKLPDVRLEWRRA